MAVLGIYQVLGWGLVTDNAPKDTSGLLQKKRSYKYDLIICQEKLDGSCVSVARIDKMLYPLTRAGYIASCSEFEHHHKFAEWVYANQERFLAVLSDGARLCGEWLQRTKT